MPVLILLDAVAAVGVAFAAYRTAKALKAPVPSDDATRVLQFWVLFALVHLASSYVTMYTRELKMILMVACFVPGDSGVGFARSMYESTAAPLMLKVGTPAARHLRTWRRFVQSTVSALSRNALEAAIPALLEGASTEELSLTEVSLENCLARLTSERQHRRTAQLEKSAFWRAKTPRRASADRVTGATTGAAAEASQKEVAAAKSGSGGDSDSDNSSHSPRSFGVTSPESPSDYSLHDDDGDVLGERWTMVSESRRHGMPGTEVRRRGGKRGYSVGGALMTPQPRAYAESGTGLKGE